MKRLHIRLFLDRKWSMPLIGSSVIVLLGLLVVTLGYGISSSGTDSSSHELKFTALDRSFDFEDRVGLPKLPRFAYLISGTKGDAPRLRRVLQAVYHPRNFYLLHLDLEASDTERLEVAKYVKSEVVFREFRNVMVVGKANLVTYKGPTMIACTLHAIAILLKRAKEWDWFINLSASDYPLMSQDGSFLSCANTASLTLLLAVYLFSCILSWYRFQLLSFYRNGKYSLIVSCLSALSIDESILS